MMTEIGEITVGTLLKRVKCSYPPYITKGRTYVVVKIGTFGVRVLNDQGHGWNIDHNLYKIVGHIDNGIIEELDQMLEFCLKYNELESYIVNNA